jgi:hypothetical protein
MPGCATAKWQMYPGKEWKYACAIWRNKSNSVGEIVKKTEAGLIVWHRPYFALFLPP